jgi:hypothetical protein
MAERTAGPDLSDRIDVETQQRRAAHFEASSVSIEDRLAAFPRFVDRSSLSRFVVRYEIFKRIAGVQGSIVECGVHNAAGLFTFANLSVLLEPFNHRRRVIGFDTFAGFPSVSERDDGSAHARIGGYAGSPEEEILEAIELFDGHRPLAEIPKVHVVAGDFLTTGPAFVEANPHLVVSLLYLDFDLLEPTAKALELFLPRMPAGAIVAFDEVNCAEWPGETQALLRSINLRRLRLERMPITSVCWAELDGTEA